jgi:hypothetical protein
VLPSQQQPPVGGKRQSWNARQSAAIARLPRRLPTPLESLEFTSVAHPHKRKKKLQLHHRR